MRKLCKLLLAIPLLSACASTSVGPDFRAGKKTELATSASILKALDGGLIDRSGVVAIDRIDREKALGAEYEALERTPAGEPVFWRSDVSGLKGEVVASQPYRVGSQDCRPYTHTISEGTELRTARGTACRNADGSWTPLT